MTPESRRTFRISSWLYARALGCVLLVAFLSLGVQAFGLFGQSGVMPIVEFVASAKRAGHGVLAHPSLFWWASSDTAIVAVLWVGGLSSLALIAGVLPKLSLLVSWVAYLSFVSVGWPFMSFQWDTLLLETSFVSIFFVPWSRWDRLSIHSAPHPVARWAVWWLLFRLMFRSAYVKLASHDPTWTDLTALSYHYWTQPLPTVLAWYADRLPLWFQKVACALMFVIEFAAPFLMWIPRAPFRRAAAGLITGLMVLIAATGNYGFFNLLTIVLCIPLLDDALLERLLRSKGSPADAPSGWRHHIQAVAPAFVIALSAVIFYAGTFGRGMPPTLVTVYRFSTLNNYGLFAVMTTDRPEIIIEGSQDDGKTWKAYEFRYKPGPLSRPPVWTAPHQPRLDWQMWFAALSDFRRNVWLARFMRRLLEAEPSVVALLEYDPFKGEPPRQIRATMYQYRFSTGAERRSTGDWWVRDEPALYAPVLTADR